MKNEEVIRTAAQDINRNVALWMLNVLEKGAVLGSDAPRFHGTAEVDDAIKARVRALRARLGHPDPSGFVRVDRGSVLLDEWRPVEFHQEVKSAPADERLTAALERLTAATEKAIASARQTADLAKQAADDAARECWTVNVALNGEKIGEAVVREMRRRPPRTFGIL